MNHKLKKEVEQIKIYRKVVHENLEIVYDNFVQEYKLIERKLVKEKAECLILN